MNGRDRTDTAWWAQALGLVPVPLFGAHRSHAQGGAHAVMLDGESGSFSLSITDRADELLESRSATDWAWSSNLLHSVVVDGANGHVFSQRWDAPNDIREWSINNIRAARKMLDAMEDSPIPTMGETVIERALHAFRSVRVGVEENYGNAVDVVRAFNVLLAWLASNRPHPEGKTLGDAVDILSGEAFLAFRKSDLTGTILNWRIGDLVAELREGQDPDSQFLLDADLLIRHAIGTLYQEAHRELLTDTRNRREPNLFRHEAFPILRDESPRSQPASFIHHTPPSLARVLIEIARRFCRRPDEGITILDPACGSGVFLAEMIRELQLRHVSVANIFGFDSSDIATAMSRARIGGVRGKYTASIETKNALAGEWPPADVVLMNPPFLKWQDMVDADRQAVESTIGPDMMEGRPDLAFAFLLKALRTIPEGGVVATILPASFLESQSARKIRSLIVNGEFTVHLVGLFKGFNYFDAIIEPVVLVVSRDFVDKPVRILTAQAGFASKAIRALRAVSSKTSFRRSGYELYNVPLSEFEGDTWVIQPLHRVEFRAHVEAHCRERVRDIFIPRLGVRLGHRKALMLSLIEFPRICSRESEKAFFRPVADEIEHARIVPSGYVFYPYGEDGRLLLDSEESVASAVPLFYRECLLPNKAELVLRKSLHHRNWWEPSEPVATWLAKRERRIVSRQFGTAGDFALDDTGECAVVKGVGWCLKSDAPPRKETLLAYLAILNSRLFARLIECYCPASLGGQFDLTAKFIKHIPLPGLDGTIESRLADTGLAMHLGKKYSPQELELAVRIAYGLPQHDTATTIDERFRELAAVWKDETAYISRVRTKLQHFAYRRIVEMGSAAVGFMLRDLEANGPADWFVGLSQITGENPITEEIAGKMQEMTNAWIQWGRRNRYLND